MSFLSSEYFTRLKLVVPCTHRARGFHQTAWFRPPSSEGWRRSRKVSSPLCLSLKGSAPLHKPPQRVPIRHGENRAVPLHSWLTGAVAKLEAEVGAPETVYRNRQLDHLTPAGAVVVVQHEGAILAGVGLPAAQTDAVLRREGRMLGVRSNSEATSLTNTVLS